MSKDYVNDFNNFENININNEEEEKEILTKDLISKPFKNNQIRPMIENNFQIEINEKNRSNSFNHNQRENNKINYYRDYNKLERIDFRKDIHTKYFDCFQFKAFKKEKNNSFNEYDGEEESKDNSINILNNNEEEKDNTFFENSHNSPLKSFKNGNIIYGNEKENDNELIDKEDSKFSNHINEDDNDQNKGNLYLEENINSKNDEEPSNSNSLQNSIIRLSNQEEIKENENNELNENRGNQIILIEARERPNNFRELFAYYQYRMALIRFFGFDPDGFENENINQSNESSFYSFDENNNTIIGSTDSSIHDSNNNSNEHSDNSSLNDNSNNEEKNLSQELLICSGEKTEDKK